MTKGYSIELPLSRGSRESLLEKLVQVDGPWQGEDFTPHLSLAVIREPTDQVDALRQIVRRFAEETEAIPIRLSAMGIFPGKRPVLTFMPACHDRLLASHHAVADQLAEAGILPIPYYEKHQWSPHVTIMMGRPRREVSAAMEKLSRVWWPGEYVLDEIELVEFNPATKLEKRVLGSKCSQ